MSSILNITPEILRDDMLRQHVYADLEHEFYWDDSWDPDFYVALARAGFICIAHPHEELGPLLLPQIQGSYAVLDWPDLHRSRNLKRLMRSSRLVDERVELRVSDSLDAVLERLEAYHETASEEGSWLLAPYETLVRKLPSSGEAEFSIHGVELWSGRRNQLVAGEIGYSIGSTYTSLTGFCSPAEPELRHYGTLQLYLLAERLRDCGYAFWNLGHAGLPYKESLGARTLTRAAFLERWMGARDAAPLKSLARSGVG